MDPIAIMIAAGMLLGTPEPGRPARAESTWCHVASSPTDGALYEDARFLPVRLRNLEEAFALLQDREALALSGADLRRFLDRRESEGGKRYYLVRGVVHAPSGSDLRGAYDYVRSAHYQLYFTPDRTAVVVASQAAFAAQVARYNVPLVLETSAALNRLVVVCYYIP